MSDRWLWQEARPGLSEAGIAHPHQFDIHGGGIDLVFPHHENEIAQSRCAFGTSVMANTWLHNGFLQVEGEKMSKSLGNFVTIRDVLKDWPGEVARLSMLKTHYRQPIDWTVRGLEESERTLTQWSEVSGDDVTVSPSPDIVGALEDDLNTPQAISELHALANARATSGLAGSLALLGISLTKFRDWKESRAQSVASGIGDVDGLIAARAAARKAKDFKRADEIRAELDAMGITLKDSKDPKTGELVTTWEVKR
jgi:cysteinyl-tRNA synthetase